MPLESSLCLAHCVITSGFGASVRRIQVGAALGPEVFLFFRALGINLKQVYGQTESTVSCVQRDDQVALGTVGTPFPNVELQLSPDGEVIVRGPCVFLGYYKNPEATASTIRDGWLYSGDAAFFDHNGQLVVIDRAKDVTALANGTKFAPQFIENKLKFSPYIKEAVTIRTGPPVCGRDDQHRYGKRREMGRASPGGLHHVC